MVELINPYKYKGVGTIKTNIFIPQKINVGFQNRSDTYTKKLAYVIYYDEKGKLRKEKSWNSWRDNKIDNIEFTNEPTSGFVLNKKVGDYGGWNHRQAYVRIYDPRNFEFEVTIENLLYILENTSSIKGKGLEGEFVYGWDKDQLILIPTSSPDYVEISQFNKIIHERNYVKSKDLIVGGTYKAKDNVDWIYMGRFDLKDTKTERIDEGIDSSSYYGGRKYRYETHKISKGKHYYFIREVDYSWREKYDNKQIEMITLKSLGDKFINVVSVDCVEDYASLFEWIERQKEYSHRDISRDVWKQYTLKEFENRIAIKEFNESRWGSRINIYVALDKYEELHYDVNSLQFYKTGEWDSEKREHKKIYIGGIAEVYRKYSPLYKNEYLENGKLYRRIE